MKGNNGSGNIEERDLWETDQDLFDILNEQYNFQIDCCASENNKKCFFYYDDFINQYTTICKDSINWMNPPFSKANLMFEHFFKVIEKGIAIYRCDNMETKVWQDIILKNCDWVFIPKGRWTYNFFEFSSSGIKNKGSRFPSALIGVGVEPPKDLNGVTLFKNGKNKKK